MLLSTHAGADAESLKARFQGASPFRHLVLDGFLDPGFAERLLASFPEFERGNRLNENGEAAGKSVVERVRELGPAYAELDDMVKSAAFLRWLSAATGIPHLRYDPWYFGGGTHENRHGQDLDPHIDFNRHPETGWHRRLNLIVYLNHEWQDTWGGSLELHSDPRSDSDRVELVTPLFNRCVVFETTESSWHGFSRIQLPEDRRGLSRKSIALYFYTAERPREELAPTHSTVYVDRPLPEHVRAGHTLTEADMAELRALLTRRDMHNQRLYEELGRLQSQVAGDRGDGDGQLRRFADGWARFLGARGRPLRERIKTSFQPFVAGLPAPLRSALRRAWRFSARFGGRRGRCVLCGAPAGQVATIGPVSPTHPGPFRVAEYRLVHCSECDAVRLHPQPSRTDLQVLYQDSVQFSDETYTAPDNVARMLDYYGQCIDRFGLMPNGGACLEVGAGYAWVSRAVKQRDASVETVAQDVSGECERLCPWVDRYLVGPIESVPRERRYDLVSLTHVIEHVTDPAAVLGSLAKRLRDGGRIFVTAPYRPRGWTTDAGIDPWLQYSYLHVPAHISYLSRSWFERVAAQSGLQLVHWDDTQDDGQAFEAILQR